MLCLSSSGHIHLVSSQPPNNSSGRMQGGCEGGLSAWFTSSGSEGSVSSSNEGTGSMSYEGHFVPPPGVYLDSLFLKVQGPTPPSQRVGWTF